MMSREPAPFVPPLEAALPPPPPPPVPMMSASRVEMTVTPPPAQTAPEPERPPAPQAMPDEDDPVEVARQLATLSPKAAAAVAHASDPNGQADPDGLLLEVDNVAEEDEAINRNLLIKFLSSVKN
jgi:hypothetical protein